MPTLKEVIVAAYQIEQAKEKERLSKMTPEEQKEELRLMKEAECRAYEEYQEKKWAAVNAANNRAIARSQAAAERAAESAAQKLVNDEEQKKLEQMVKYAEESMRAREAEREASLQESIARAQRPISDEEQQQLEQIVKQAEQSMYARQHERQYY